MVTKISITVEEDTLKLIVAEHLNATVNAPLF